MSSTDVLELQSYNPHAQHDRTPRRLPQALKNFFPKKGSARERVVDIPPADQEEHDLRELPSPTTANTVEEVQRWNRPRGNIYRIFSSFFALLVMGSNDGAYGALVPYLQRYYGESYTVISLVFLSPFIGYILAALLNNTIHMRYGQRGIALIGPGLKTVAYVAICVHPPYPVLVVCYAIVGFGIGVCDAAWNAWVGPFANANEILGLMHGCYGLGATLAPLIATTLIDKAGWSWYAFYYILVGASVIEWVTSTHAFWEATGPVYRRLNPRTTDKGDNRLKEALFTMPSARTVWLSAMFLTFYMGAEVSLGGWIVTFMRQVRQGTPFASGMTATGFWLGLTVGRVVLGFVTGRIGEKLAISIYLPIAMALELLFWLVPQFYVSAVAVALQGFFIGPLFPAAVIAATKLLPKHLHVAAIGFATAVGGSGAAVFPFAVGAIAQARGVKVLQPIILALFAAILACWLALPRFPKKKD